MSTTTQQHFVTSLPERFVEEFKKHAAILGRVETSWEEVKPRLATLDVTGFDETTRHCWISILMVVISG